VNPALLLLAGIAVTGAVLAVSARDARAALVGVLLVLLAAPLVAAPWPGSAAVVVRVAGALLATRFLLIALRGEVATGGTRIGWPAEALVAGAAAVVGFGSHGLGAEALGPVEAQAAGFALIALAIAPIATGRDVVRVGLGSIVLLTGAGLVRTGVATPAADAEHLVGALLTIALGGAVAVIAVAARAAGTLALDPPPTGGRESSRTDRAVRGAQPGAGVGEA
jgi:hypothetical protein